MDIGHVKA